MISVVAGETSVGLTDTQKRALEALDEARAWVLGGDDLDMFVVLASRLDPDGGNSLTFGNWGRRKGITHHALIGLLVHGQTRVVVG